MHNVSDYELYHSFPSRKKSARNSAMCFAWQKTEVPLEKEKGRKVERKEGTRVCYGFFCPCSKQISKCKQVRTSPMQS